MNIKICFIVIILIFISLMIYLINKNKEKFNASCNLETNICQYADDRILNHEEWLKKYINYRENEEKTIIQPIVENIIETLDEKVGYPDNFVGKLSKYNPEPICTTAASSDATCPVSENTKFQTYKKFVNSPLSDNIVKEIVDEFLDILIIIHDSYDDSLKTYNQYLIQYIQNNYNKYYDPNYGDSNIDPVINKQIPYVNLVTDDFNEDVDSNKKYVDDSGTVREYKTYELPLKINLLAKYFIEYVTSKETYLLKQYLQQFKKDPTGQVGVNIDIDPSITKLKNLLSDILIEIMDEKNDKKIKKDDLPCAMYHKYDCPSNRCSVDNITGVCSPNENEHTIDVDKEQCDILSPYGKDYCEYSNCKYNTYTQKCYNIDVNIDDTADLTVHNSDVLNKYNCTNIPYKRYVELVNELNKLNNIIQSGNGSSVITNKKNNIEKIIEKIKTNCHIDHTRKIILDGDSTGSDYKKNNGDMCVNFSDYINNINEKDYEYINGEHCSTQCSENKIKKDCNSKICHWEADVDDGKCSLKNKCRDLNEKDCKEATTHCEWNSDDKKCFYNNENNKLVHVISSNSNFDEDVSCDIYDNSDKKYNYNKKSKLVSPDDKDDSEQIRITDQELLQNLCEDPHKPGIRCKFHKYNTYNKDVNYNKCLNSNIVVDYNHNSSQQSLMEKAKNEKTQYKKDEILSHLESSECNNLNFYEDCESKDTCYWDRTNYNNCTLLNNKDECNSIEGCLYNTDINKCVNNYDIKPKRGYCKNFDTKKLDNLVKNLYEMELDKASNFYINQEKINNIISNLKQNDLVATNVATTQAQ